MPIALDAMGGDLAPACTVDGALRAHRERGVEVVLVGDEACKGLCPQCGKDLNQGECGCERTSIDPRWAALKGIQLQKKEK